MDPKFLELCKSVTKAAAELDAEKANEAELLRQLEASRANQSNIEHRITGYREQMRAIVA